MYWKENCLSFANAICLNSSSLWPWDFEGRAWQRNPIPDVSRGCLDAKQQESNIRFLFIYGQRHTSHFGRAVWNCSNWRDQNATFHSIDYGNRTKTVKLNTAYPSKMQFTPMQWPKWERHIKRHRLCSTFDPKPLHSRSHVEPKSTYFGATKLLHMTWTWATVTSPPQL